MRNFTLWLLFLLFPTLTIAKVEAPNYQFKLETLDPFYPQKNLANIPSSFNKPENVNSSGLKKYLVKELRYNFPVLVQEREGVILDFFARLPSYFLHDVFFQSLVNRLGKQKTYKKIGEEAFYIWEKDNLKHIYSAACTITCFPIFYTVHPIEIPPERAFTPLLKQMQNALK